MRPPKEFFRGLFFALLFSVPIYLAIYLLYRTAE